MTVPLSILSGTGHAYSSRYGLDKLRFAGEIVARVAGKAFDAP